MDVALLVVGIVAVVLLVVLLVALSTWGSRVMREQRATRAELGALRIEVRALRVVHEVLAPAHPPPRAEQH